MATPAGGGADDDGPQWSNRWHLAADGSVVHERSKGDQPHQQVYRRDTTTRPVTLDDIAALPRELDELGRAIDRAFRPWAVVIWSTILVVLLGAALLALDAVGVVGGGAEVGIVLILVSVLVACVMPLVLRARAQRGPDRSPEPLFLAAGFTSSEADTTLSIKQTDDLVRAPGTVSGPASAGEGEWSW